MIAASKEAAGTRCESLVWHFSLFAAGGRLAETLITGKERFVFEHFIKGHATNQDVFTPALLDLYARSNAKPDSLHAAFEYYRALNETERRNAPLAATKIAVPVLAVGGIILWSVLARSR